MKHLPLILAIAIAFASSAHAGWKLAPSIAAVTIDDANQQASGTLGGARNTADSTQQLACWVVATSAGLTGECHAMGVTGTARRCTTSDPNMLQAIMAVSGDSFVSFRWKTLNGPCTRIEVYANSAAPPKVL